MPLFFHFPFSLYLSCIHLLIPIFASFVPLLRLYVTCSRIKGRSKKRTTHKKAEHQGMKTMSLSLSFSLVDSHLQADQWQEIICLPLSYAGASVFSVSSLSRLSSLTANLRIHAWRRKKKSAIGSVTTTALSLFISLLRLFHGSCHFAV